MEFNTYNIDLLGSMDRMYRGLLSESPPEVHFLESEMIDSGQFMGRWLGFVMAFVCSNMVDELHKAQSFMDFPHCERISNAIFKLDWMGNIEIPPMAYSYGGNGYVDNPLSMQNIIAKMGEEEKKVLHKLEIKAKKIGLPFIYDYDQVELGVEEGLLIYLKHPSYFPKLAEDIAFQTNSDFFSEIMGSRSEKSNGESPKIWISYIFWSNRTKTRRLNENLAIKPASIISSEDEETETVQQKELTKGDVRSALLNWNKSIEEIRAMLTKQGMDEFKAQTLIDDVCDGIHEERKRKTMPHFIAGNVMVIGGVWLIIAKVYSLGVILCFASLFCLRKAIASMKI